jgi:hypothetical protein
MPEDLAIGVVVKQLALAYCYIRCGITWDASWAVRPSVTLPEDWEYVRKAIGINAGYTDLDKRLADWSNEPAMADLSQELEKDAFWYFDSIGQDAGLIYR